MYFFVALKMKNVNNKITRVATSTPNLNLGNLLDVNTASATNGQGLVRVGATWTGQNIVNSFNTRTGIVTPQSGDYSISQITNSSVLASTTGVNIASPVTGQALTYNGSQWINSTLVPYYTTVFTYATTVTAVANTYYTLNFGGAITINPFNVGDKIMITAGANSTTVVLPGCRLLQILIWVAGPAIQHYIY